ncbi:PilW family protein [Propionivibrio sp.]|uniref:PilW family protein n=1 Tax=Propionivibrio sp. TaxID=2212460 RepID=UPI0039E5A09C
MKLRFSPAANRQAGLSMIELMVALAIGLFMTAAIGGLYVTMRGGYRYQDDYARLQEAGRFAIGMIGNDIRLAGFRGSDGDEAASFINAISGTDVRRDFANPLRGYNDGGLDGGLKTAIQSAGGPAAANISSSSDALLLLGVDPLGELIVKEHDAGTKTFKVATAPSALRAGDYLLATTYARAVAFEAASVDSTGKQITYPVDLVGTSYPSGASLHRLFSRLYFIAPSPAGTGVNSLWSMERSGNAFSVAEVVHGVDQMQLTYGIDNNGDQSVNEFTATPSDWSQVIAVKIAILAVTPNDNISAAPQTYEFNGTSITATDRRVRKVFTELVTLRNRAL